MNADCDKRELTVALRLRKFLSLYHDTFGEAAPAETGSQKRLQQTFLITQLWLDTADYSRGETIMGKAVFHSEIQFRVFLIEYMDVVPSRA